MVNFSIQLLLRRDRGASILSWVERYSMEEVKRYSLEDVMLSYHKNDALVTT